MKNTLKDTVEEKASEIKEFWFDVDGVMTQQGDLIIYEMATSNNQTGCLKRKDGVDFTFLVPCDHNGRPNSTKVEYIAGDKDNRIFEGYRFDTRDGKVVEILVENGFPVYFISGRNSCCVRQRALALGAIPVLGEKDKLLAIKSKTSTPLSQIMFVGDGIQDCDTLKAAGLSISPADACHEAIESSMCQTKAKGGEGVLYEILSVFLKARGLWPN